MANLINNAGDSEARDNSLCALRIFLTEDEGGRLRKGEGSKVIEAKSRHPHILLESRTQVNYCVKVRDAETIARHDD